MLHSNQCNDQPNTHLRENLEIENEFMYGAFQQEDGEGCETDPEIMAKETRGPTYMQNIWGRAPNLPPIHVEYNEFGQPIGGENSKLCHFLGSISRNGKYCPIDIKNWHAMSSTKKTEMLEVVKKWILTSIGHKWRNWKHSLKMKYWADDIPVEHLIEERDERALLDQWVKLLTYWRSEEAKKASHRNKNARENKIMNQRTGKTSFAQIRVGLIKEQERYPTRVELFKSCFVPSDGTSSVALSKYSEMQERSNQLPEGYNDEVGPNDVFSQIMGDDAPGHVQMLGQGICPSDVWSEAPRSIANRLLMEHQEKIAHLENILLMQQGSCPSQVDSGHYISSFDSHPQHPTPTLHLQDGMNVLLKRLFNPMKIVAKGYVHNTNPSTVVGGQMLGLNWCEVNVQVIVDPEERLIRLYNNLQMLSETKGAMIAWPCNLVAPIKE